MTDLPRIDSLQATAQQPHAMTNDQGEVFYPDSDEDAQWFTEQHGARPLNPAIFPFRSEPEEAA